MATRTTSTIVCVAKVGEPNWCTKHSALWASGFERCDSALYPAKLPVREPTFAERLDALERRLGALERIVGNRGVS